MNPTAQLIIAVIKAAATQHSTPVLPSSLLDMGQAMRDGKLRAHLNDIITWHLYHNHKIPRLTIAEAYRAEYRTIWARCRRGKHLIHKSPWKQTYTKLP